MQGQVIHFNREKGYGFITADGQSENIFVHVSEISNAKELFRGQSVEFNLKKTAKGLAAINVVAGAKQQSPYLIFGVVATLIVIAVFSYLYRGESIHPILSYLIAINTATFLLYGYDKFISTTEQLRVPEYTLHTLALLGGSPAGLMAQKFFRHKTVKGSFQLVYWVIVLVQIGLIAGFK